MKIIIDADACPKNVLLICQSMGNKFSVKVWTVASFNHNIKSDNHTVVGDSSQETDLKITNLCNPGDLVVTQDWGLAAMVIGKGAICLDLSGGKYEQENMSLLLEMREIKARYRRSGGKTKGPSKRTLKDDRKFETFLEQVLQENK